MKNMSIFFISTIAIVKFFYFLKDVLMAKYFGLTSVVDIYFLSILASGVVFNLLTGSSNSYLIPHYLKIKHVYGKDTAKFFVSSFFRNFTLISLGLFLVTGWLFPHLYIQYGKGFAASQAQVDLFINLSRWAAVFLFGSLVASLMTTLLQSEHRYYESIMPQFFVPLVAIFLMLWGYQRLGINSVLYGSIIGIGIHLILSGYFLNRAGLIDIFHFKKSERKFSYGLRQLLILGVALLSPALINMIDQTIASMLGEGEVAAYNYAVRIPDALSEIVGMGFGISLFSYFSSWAAEKNIKDIIKSVQHIVIDMTIFMLPFCFYVYFYSDKIIEVIFIRGEFDSRSGLYVAELLRAYIFVAYLFPIAVLGVRIISSIQKNQLILFLGFFNLMVKIILSCILVPVLFVKGLLVATMGMYLLGIAVIYLLLLREGFIFIDKGFVIKLMQGVGVAVVCIFIQFVSSFKLLSLNGFFSSFLGGLVFLVLSGSVFILKKSLRF